MPFPAIRSTLCFLALATWLGLAPAGAEAITVTIDYRFDSAGFFDPTTSAGFLARTRMQEAADLFSSSLLDPLLPIVPGAGDSWNAFFTHPGSGGNSASSNLSIAADEILVFAGARDLGGSILGQGGFGGYSVTGQTAFVNAVDTRGQTGVGTTDFAPWGGSVSFDLFGTNWYFGGSAAVPGSMTDFFSVAIHEIAHVLGLGAAASWDLQVGISGGCASGLAFMGAAAMAVNGGPVCLDDDPGHFADGTLSAGQEVSLDPSLAPGLRKLLSPLDWAALQDVGWQLSAAVPEPQGLALVALLAALGLRRSR